MTLAQYARKVGLLKKLELDKVAYIFYYYSVIEDLDEFSSKNVLDWFNTLNLGNPNVTRLIGNIKKSSKFIRGSKADTFRLHAKAIAELEEELPFLSSSSEEIVYSPSILPDSLYKGTRGYLEKFCKQINASFDHNLFDACAVLMRRLVEILLIHCYENTGQEARIKDSNGDYKPLKLIIDDAKKCKAISLSKGAKNCIDEFRVLGNFSAHKLMYNCRRDDIKNVALDYRATIEELLYIAGLRK